MNFAVVGLTSDDILAGKLAAIQNAVSDASLQSLAKAGFGKRNQAEILFDANEADLEGGFDTVLYINAAALEQVEKSGQELNIIRQSANPPSQQGTLISVPIYS